MSESCREKFNIVKKTISYSVLDFKYCATAHEGDRADRCRKALEFGDFKVISSYVVDTGHPDGLELHSITSTGVIIVGNLFDERIITYLIARPGQLRRYGIEDQHLLDIAQQHQISKYNQI